MRPMMNLSKRIRQRPAIRKSLVRTEVRRGGVEVVGGWDSSLSARDRVTVTCQFYLLIPLFHTIAVLLVPRVVDL